MQGEDGLKFCDVDGLVQERRNSIALAMELRLSCTNPLKYPDQLHNYWFKKKIGAILTWKNLSNLEFLGIFRRIHGRNGLKYSMLIYPEHLQKWLGFSHGLLIFIITGDPLHSRAACTQPCNVNTHSRAHCSPGARLCEQWGHGCVNNGARLCASARLCRGSPVIILARFLLSEMIQIWGFQVIYGELMEVYWCHAVRKMGTN